MIQTVTFASLHSRKILMLSCASAALAVAALTPGKSNAQAFQGNITGTSGSVIRTPTGSTTETLTIGSPTATINWNPTNQTPSGGPIDFLPNGNTATYTSATGVTDYTVLNRILPTSGQPIALNGHVISTLQGTSATGGHVWFYAPGGIVIGSTAVFDVGSLLLSANDVTSFGTTAHGFNATFSAPNSTAKVQIQNGAQINALQQNSYVAIVAPRIEQGGTVRVNGSAAYVAGQQLSLTMNQGLFDISVNVGTSDPNGVVHTGDTGGPASPDLSDPHRIYMIAVPKNQAVTMLLGGNIGFDDAVSADVVNGQIVLVSKAISFTSGLSTSSDLLASASGDITASAESGNIDFGGPSTTLSAIGGNVTLEASNGFSLDVAGNLNVGAGSHAISLEADGGSINVAGATTLNASSVGGFVTSIPPGSSNNGGEITINADNGGSITTGALQVLAYGAGKSSAKDGGTAGDGYGGSIFIGAENGGSVGIDGDLTADASGFGGNAPAQGGYGEGGDVELFTNGGAIAINGNVGINANGSGGTGISGGAGQGGVIELFAEDGSLNANQLTLAANGTSGSGALGGNGGWISVEGSGGTVSADALNAQANGSDNGGNVSLLTDSGWEDEQEGGLQFGSTDVTANGGEIGGSIFVGAGGGTTIDLGDADLAANGAFGGSIELLAGMCNECEGDGFDSESGGGITADNLTLTTSGNIYATTNGADIDIDGTFRGDAGQAISLADTGMGGSMRAHDFELTAITIDDSANLFGDIVNFTSAGDMNVGTIVATDLINLTAGGDLSAGDLIASNTLTLNSGGDLSTGDLFGGNTLTVNSGGNLQTGDMGSGTIDVTAAGNISTSDVHADESATFTAGGDIQAGDVFAANALTLKSGGDLQTGDLESKTVDLTAGGDSSVGNVDASGSATFAAGGLATFNGVVGSPTITVTSSDIDIAEGASLGVFGVTKLLTLNAVSDLPVIVGDGPASEGQYQLDESGDIQSAAVVLNAIGTDGGPTPDIKIFDFGIDGSNTAGGGIGSFAFNTSGSVFVDGKLDFHNAGATDSLTINAGHAIEVNTDSGGIRIADSTGKLTGVLDLSADNIWVASGAVLSQLETNVNFVGRDDALATNSGVATPEGFVRTGTINATIANSFLVQNSGTPQLFGGIDTGPGGLSITNSGTVPATLIIYGRETDSTGTLITNEDFLGRVQVSGPAGFTDDSSVNGCAIGAASCDEISFMVDMSSILGAIDQGGDDDKKKKDQDDASDDGSGADPSLRLINTRPLNLDHPIDQPVTSGGDVVVGGPVQPN